MVIVLMRCLIDELSQKVNKKSYPKAVLEAYINENSGGISRNKNSFHQNRF